jgi:predicted anti-sigma-YlaC factor YlaD
VARRLHRHLDRDPAAPLADREIARILAHLQDCPGCRGLEAEYRRLGRLLRGIRARTEPDSTAVERIRTTVRART